MPVFRFKGKIKNREERIESGTVKADSETEAKKKLAGYRFESLSLKKISGMTGFLRSFNPDVK